MSLASLVTMRKAATISGILLGIAVLEYIVIMHLYIDLRLREKQQFAVGEITTEATVPVLEDWGARLRKVATQNAETAKRTFKDSKKLQNLTEMIKLKKCASNISDTKPLEMDGERRTNVAGRISTKGRSPIGRWGPPTAAAAAAGGGGGEGEQHQNEEKKPSEDYVDSVMEMERAGRDVKQPNARFPIDESEIEIMETEHEISVVKKQLGPEVLVENDTRLYRTLTKFEKEGGNIMFTLRTTLSYHEGRLPLMFDTWMSETDCSRIFLVTDGYDWVTQAKVRLKGELLMGTLCTSRLLLDEYTTVYKHSHMRFPYTQTELFVLVEPGFWE